MSWHFLPELAAGFSEAIFSGGEPSARSSASRTGARRSFNDSVTGCCRCFPSGTTPEPSTASRGEAESTSSLQVFLASLSASPANEWPTPTSATDGPTQSESFAQYDRDGACWRTSQASLLTLTSEPFSDSWPKQGTMRSGRCFPRPTSGHHTSENDSGLWPSPRVSRGDYTRDKGKKGAERATLSGAVKTWATPSTRDWKDTPGMSRTGPDGRKREDQLARQVYAEMWPTPTTSDHKHPGNPRPPDTASAKGLAARARWATPRVEDGQCAGGHRGKSDTLYSQIVKSPDGGTPTRQTWTTPTKATAKGSTAGHGTRDLRPEVGGQLNPEWVEWLMGWPIGWTALQPLATDKFRSWLLSLSASLPPA